MNISVITDSYGLRRMKDELASKTVLSIDTETTGLEFYKHRIFMIQISDGNNMWVIDCKNDHSFLCEVRTLLIELFTGTFRTIIGHNLKFDLHHIQASFNIYYVPNLVWDTKVAAHLINENKDNHLKSLMKSELNIDPEDEKKILDWFKSKKIKKASRDYSLLPREMIIPYAAMDAWATFKLYEKFKPVIDQHFSTLFQTEMDALKILLKMEHNGLPINTSYLSELKTTYILKIQHQKIRLEELAGKMNFKSSKQVKEFLQNELELDIYDPVTGKETTNSAVLKRLTNNQFVKELLHYRELCKIHSTYIENLLEHNHNGIIHGNYNSTGTVTGRLSCSAPNIQNQSKNDDIKRAFIVSPGERMTFWDQSQIEMVGFAWYSQEPKLLEAFRTGKDIYQSTAAQVLKKKFEDVTPHERQMFKNMNLAIIYGVGNKKLANYLNTNLDNAVSKEEAIKFRESYLQEFKNISNFSNKIINRIRYNRPPWGNFIQNYFGRVRRINPQDAYTGVNHLIQGWAADLMKASMVRIEKKLQPKWRLQLHDEIRIDTPIDMKNYRDFCQEVSECLTNWSEFNVPIRVKITNSDTNWAEEKPLGEKACLISHGVEKQSV